MKLGNLSFAISVLLIFFDFTYLSSQEKVNLQDLQPTFEEEADATDSEKGSQILKIKSKKKTDIGTSETVVKFRALDKITAKTSDIAIIVGKKKRVGHLEILPKKCTKSQGGNNKGVVAYIQVKDLSERKSDKVFVFNGWTFSSSPSLKEFDHPIYDLWLTGCENI
jgi:hypothetical protein